MAEESTSRPWSAFDNRCDACGSESFYHFERLVSVAVSAAPAGTSPLSEEEWTALSDARVEEFYFCGHHGNQHKAKLTERGFDHNDFTHLINPTPSVSADV